MCVNFNSLHATVLTGIDVNVTKFLILTYIKMLLCLFQSYNLKKDDEKYLKQAVVAFGVSGFSGGVAQAEDAALKANMMIFDSLCSEFGGSMKAHPFCKIAYKNIDEYRSATSQCREDYSTSLQKARERYSNVLATARETYFATLSSNRSKKESQDMTVEEFNRANGAVYEIKNQTNNAA